MNSVINRKEPGCGLRKKKENSWMLITSPQRIWCSKGGVDLTWRWHLSVLLSGFHLVTLCSVLCFFCNNGLFGFNLFFFLIFSPCLLNLVQSQNKVSFTCDLGSSHISCTVRHVFSLSNTSTAALEVSQSQLLYIVVLSMKILFSPLFTYFIRKC